MCTCLEVPESVVTENHSCSFWVEHRRKETAFLVFGKRVTALAKGVGDLVLGPHTHRRGKLSKVH